MRDKKYQDWYDTKEYAEFERQLRRQNARFVIGLVCTGLVLVVLSVIIPKQFLVVPAVPIGGFLGWWFVKGFRDLDIHFEARQRSLATHHQKIRDQIDEDFRVEMVAIDAKYRPSARPIAKA